jgi:hypothetical protein
VLRIGDLLVRHELASPGDQCAGDAEERSGESDAFDLRRRTERERNRERDAAGDRERQPHRRVQLAAPLRAVHRTK